MNPGNIDVAKPIVMVAGIMAVMTLFLPLDGRDLSVGGEARTRLRYIRTDSSEITGTYGEVLKRGVSFRQRVDLFLTYPILEQYLSLEAGIRISNEGADAMTPPPDLVSTDILAGWWSLNLARAPFLLTVGSFETSFTPLTLMRWDTGDNPLAAAGCACQISVGGIGSESLEEPQEDYRLEGVKAEAGGEIGDAKAIFSRTQMAREGETYARYLIGARSRLVFDPPLLSAVSLGGTLLAVRDDFESVHIAFADPLGSDVGGVDLNVPVAGGFGAVSELAFSRRDDNLLSSTDAIRRGNGIIAGVQFRDGDRLDAQGLYLQMDPYFSPLYRALSYAKNRQGARISLTHRTIGMLGKRLAASVYIKKLREIKPTWLETITEGHHSLAGFLIATGSVNIPLAGNIKAGADYEFRTADRADDAATLNDERLETRTHIASGSIIYEFTMQSKLTLKYQYTRNTEGAAGADYSAQTPSMQFSLKF